MTSSFFTINRPKSFSMGNLAIEEKEVTETTSNENEVDDSLSEISAAGSFPPSLDQVNGISIDSSSRIRANSSDGKSSTSNADLDTTPTDPHAAPNTPLKWSSSLSTPTHPAYTPSSDMTTLRENLHGLAFKLSIDRSKLLSRTAKSCSVLLTDVASLHDELSQTVLKLFPPLESATSSTPMEEFTSHVNVCLTSFCTEMQTVATRSRNEVIRPWIEFNSDKSKVYNDYIAARTKCAQSRKDALKTRQKYVNVVKDAEVAIQSLKKAATAPRKTTERSDTSSSLIEENEEEVQWEMALKEFGKRHGIMKQCDLVARSLNEIQVAEGAYVTLVEVENAAVSTVQEVEAKGLEVMQSTEEERIIFILNTLDKFVTVASEALQDMTLELAVTPLNLDESIHKELPLPSTGSIFTPRRRTQSEDGPAINETRMLNLPDNIAELRDHMKSHLGRQSARLKVLKAVSSFNEGLAMAVEGFGVGLGGRLEGDGFVGKGEGKNASPLAAVLNKNEGPQVLKEWNKVISSLSAYATNATQLASQIKRGNSELYNILLPAKRELKQLHENEEARWKNLCEAAKGETQAKMKQKQHMNDLQKAQMRFSMADEDGAAADTNNAMGPMKMNSQVNKAMGKMFSVLPGGGEDVMNKMLNPDQRKAIREKNLDEAKKKSARATEVFSAASGVKDQSIATYQTETEAALEKFKTNERYVWAQMQKSLENSVIAVKTFRDTQLSEMSTSDPITDKKAAALSDMTQWTTSTQKRVEEYRDRYTSETKDKENDYETGFSLQLILEESSDIKELVNLVVNDNDIGCVGVEVEYDDAEKSEAPLPDVPEDPLIKTMDPIFTKTLKNVSIDSYYLAGWSEETPLYQPWLEKKGSFDVSVSEWEKAEGGYKHEWSGEVFPQKRVIKFKFKRTTHLYIGPPVAGVTQTQYCRLESNDRCVTMMTAEMDGIPYSDVFAVEVRWSARRQGNNDVVIDAGMHVRFIKSSMFAKQIKSGTLTETKPIHLSLFETIKVAIASDENNDVETIEQEEQEVEVETRTPVVEKATHKEPEKASPFKTYAKQLSNTFWSLPKEYQVISGVIFFGTIWAISRRGMSSEQQKLDDLKERVDALSSELAEIKSLLKTIVHLMGEGQRIQSDTVTS